MKRIIQKNKVSSNEARMIARQTIENLLFNAWLSKFKFEKVTDEQNEYLLRKFYCLGTIGSFIVEGTKLEKGEIPESVNSYPNGMIAFVPYAPTLYNIYDYPIKVQPIQVRGATFIPNREMIVNKDFVIGFAQRNKKPVKAILDFYIDKILDIEMTIRVQLKSHKTPWLITTSPEDENKLKALFDKIENDEEVLFLSAQDVEALKVLVSGNNYIIDKLLQAEQHYWNSAWTYLGVNNLGITEKAEHLITSEVDANNEIVDSNGDNFLECLKEFCDRINKYLGYPISVRDLQAEKQKEMQEQEKEEEENVETSIQNKNNLGAE